MEESFLDVYDVGEVIASGINVEVKTCTNRVTGQIYAVKIINVSNFNAKQQDILKKQLKREEEMSIFLKHPLVSSLLEVYNNEEYYYMIYNHLEGADLCLEIVNRASSGFVYSEAVASHYMKQLLEAIRFIHSKNVVHRNIRMNCVCLASRENSSPVKICSFENVTSVEELESSEDYVIDDDMRRAGQVIVCTEKDKFGYFSSPCFSAPEITQNQYHGKAVDLWSAGCALYVLLSGYPPFLGEREQRDRAAVNGAYSLSGKQWDVISEEAKNLIRRMLDVSPTRRITAEEALAHPWIKERSQVPKLHLAETVRSMQKFNEYRALKDSIVSTIIDCHWLLSSNQDRTADEELTNESEASSNDIGGGHVVLDCIEGVEALENCDHIPVEIYEELVKDDKLNFYLQIFENINNRLTYLSSTPQPDSLNRQINEVLNGLNNQNPLNSSLDRDQVYAIIDEINSIFTQTHFQTLCKVHDLLANKVNILAELRLVDRSSQLAINSNNNNNNVNNNTINSNTINRLQSNQQSFFGSAIGSSDTLRSNSNNNNNNFNIVDNITNNNNNNNSSNIGGYNSNTLKSSNSNSSSSNTNTVDRVLRLRLVQFQKNTDEPMGITFKMTNDGRCIVSRILDGGLIHRQGTLHVGDEIREINGKLVEGETLENMQKLVRDCRGNVAFKILQSSRSQPMHSERFVRTLFSYDPLTDPHIPSVQAGLKFEIGDVLRIVCQDDSMWWQARRWNFPKNSPAKLIPSPEQREYRVAEEDRQKKKSNGSWLSRRKRIGSSSHQHHSNQHHSNGHHHGNQHHKDKYLVKHNSLFDQLELNTYEEVIRLPSFLRKTLVLLGAHGVGRRHIKNLFITRQSYKYAYPIPHTTRQPRPEEEHGRNYFFVSHEQMSREIADNQYLEYGTHEGAIYGTKLETIRQIHRQGLVAILDIEPQALKILRTAEYAPFVVFIAAPSNIALMNDSSLERLARESSLLEQTYRHTFDLKIVNNDIDETIRELEMAMDYVNKNPQWVPVGWVY